MHVTKCACFEQINTEVTTGHTQSSLTLFRFTQYSIIFLVFTSLLPCQAITLSSTYSSSYRGLYLLCNRTHTQTQNSSRKLYFISNSIRQCSIMLMKKPQHVSDLLMSPAHFHLCQPFWGHEHENNAVSQQYTDKKVWVWVSVNVYVNILRMLN